MKIRCSSEVGTFWPERPDPEKHPTHTMIWDLMNELDVEDTIIITHNRKNYIYIKEE